MNVQLTLFDIPCTSVKPEAEIIMFPGYQPRKHNYHKGKEQTVYPIKKHDQLKAMASWLYQNADLKYLMAFILGINLGLRANELLSLRQSYLFSLDGTIRKVDDLKDTTDRLPVYQSKNDKIRGLYLNDACASILTKCYEAGNPKIYNKNFLFPSREGGHIKPDTLRKVLKDAAEACQIKQNIGTHTLRKTFGYHHYQQFHDIGHLQRLFGHSSGLITMRYIGIMEEDDKAAYNSMNLDVMEDLQRENKED